LDLQALSDRLQKGRCNPIKYHLLLGFEDLTYGKERSHLSSHHFATHKPFEANYRLGDRTQRPNDQAHPPPKAQRPERGTSGKRSRRRRVHRLVMWMLVGWKMYP